MSKKGGDTQNYERPLSPQELALYETQNKQLEKGIAIAEEQEARSQDQYAQYNRDFLPDLAMGTGNNDQYVAQMDRQMPNYAEDTSGARSQSFNYQPQPQGGAKGAGGQSVPRSGAKGA